MCIAMVKFQVGQTAVILAFLNFRVVKFVIAILILCSILCEYGDVRLIFNLHKITQL